MPTPYDEELKRLDEDEAFRRSIYDKMRKDALELAAVKATFLVNFGQPCDDFEGGKLAKIVPRHMSATAMFVEIYRYLAKETLPSQWHHTADQLPNVGWPVIGEDSSGRRAGMLYAESGEGGHCWFNDVHPLASDFRKAEFAPVRWHYLNSPADFLRQKQES